MFRAKLITPEVEELVAGVDAALRSLKPQPTYVVRDLLPKDLGLTNEKWFLTLGDITADQYNGYIDIDLDDEVAVALVGILLVEDTLDTATTQIRVKRGKTDIAIIPIEAAADMANQGHAYLEQAIVVDGNVNLAIDLWCNNGAADEQIGFLGRIIEKRDININPKQKIYRATAPARPEEVVVV